MRNLVGDLLSQGHAHFGVSHVQVDGIAEIVGIALVEIEAGELHAQIGDVEVLFDEVLPLQIARRPVDDAGTGKLVAKEVDQAEGQVGSRLGDAQSDLKFYDPVFQVRPFPIRHDVVSHLHLDRVGEGRPASAVAA
ncbi:hypothetical protein FJ981_27920 [Mesorhizobium sp. B1-1-4]|uniref:hypothetical protein n=1 Tax=Mesorhizobium sp. B1-1-4 TaxID=2589980 RepID=UPI001125DD24|nr:hypothetical protein [Mesorhizobium sp. B1-1-4]TPN44427.1 hypothetical protein FJ981_27920 [Mesorhizobium sp. B1-1-4]